MTAKHTPAKNRGEDKAWWLACAAALILGTAQRPATATDLALQNFSFRFDENAQMSISVELSNVDDVDSGPIAIRLYATMDLRSSGELTGERFLLVEERIEDGLAAGEAIGVNSEFRPIVEEPPAGTYNLALSIEEESFFAEEPIVVFANAPVDFPLPRVPSEAAIRRRIANQIPCGSAFVQIGLLAGAAMLTLKLTRSSRFGFGRRRRLFDQ